MVPWTDLSWQGRWKKISRVPLLSNGMLTVWPLAVSSDHYSDVIMSVMASDDCLLNHLFRCRSKKTSKIRVTGLWEGNIPRTKGQLRGKCMHLMTSPCTHVIPPKNYTQFVLFIFFTFDPYPLGLHSWLRDNLRLPQGQGINPEEYDWLHESNKNWQSKHNSINKTKIMFNVYGSWYLPCPTIHDNIVQNLNSFYLLNMSLSFKI